MIAPTPSDEAARLLDLARYRGLDTGHDQPLKRITRLASRLLRTPVAVINFVDEYRQWGAALVGVTEPVVPREHSFCAWTINANGPFVVEDARTDPRFHDNPLVTSGLRICMYAGAPLITPAGHRIGTLCVTDDQPHPLSTEELQDLQDLAVLAMKELELRRMLLEAAHFADAHRRQADELRQILAQSRVVEGVSSLMDLNLPVEETVGTAASLVGDAVGAQFTAVRLPSGDGPRLQIPPSNSSVPASVPAAVLDVLEDLQAVPGALDVRRGPVYLEAYAASRAPHPGLVQAGVDQVAVLPLGSAVSPPLLVALRFQGHATPTWRPHDREVLEVAARMIGTALARKAATDPSDAP